MTPVDRIRAEQIRFIYKNTPPGLVATAVAMVSMLGVLIYLDAVEPAKSAVLMVLMMGQVLVRLLIVRAYWSDEHRQQRWQHWGYWFTAGTVLGGLVSGAGTIWIMSTGRVDLQLIALLLIFAFTSGAVSAFGSYLLAFFGFFVTVSIAPVVWLFAQSDLMHHTLAVLYLLWFGAVTVQARQASAAFIESIKLRFENEDLVGQLRQEKAAAEEANAAKSRFLAAASHDLRQPVHALSLFVAALRPRTMDGEARNLLDHIDGSVNAMGGLFGGLLDISRLDAGVVEFIPVPVAIQPLLERVCRDYEVQAKAKGLSLTLHRCSAIVNTDPMLLERVIRNIIANAVAYTDRGRVVIGCRRGLQLRIQVWDTGCGIPAHEQSLVFQEFYQIGNPERDRSKGVGLGLAIVRRLTSLLGLALSLRSEPGRGSVFSVTVPIASASAMATAAAAENSSMLLARGAGLILVIDDELAIQVAMKCLLESWGYDVIIAGSCEEMIERIADHRVAPCLIISDYRLRDGKSGITAIESLRSEYNDDDIPGMLITGDTAPDRLREAQESGFLLLHKPVPNSRLRASIAHLVSTAEPA